jgi:predicted transcriptional regulator
VSRSTTESSPLKSWVKAALKDHPGYIESLGAWVNSKNPKQGVHRIYDCLKTGEDMHQIFDKIRSDLQLDRDQWNLMQEATLDLNAMRERISNIHIELSATKEQLKAKQRMVPYVQAVINSEGFKPSINTRHIAHLLGFDRIAVPEWVEGASHVDQLEIIGQLIREHYEQFKEKTFNVGVIESYRYHYAWRESWLFDIQGRYLKPSWKEASYEPVLTYRIGGRPFFFS